MDASGGVGLLAGGDLTLGTAGTIGTAGFAAELDV